jgi:hypothetical protein
MQADDLSADEAECLRREQARFSFYKKIESLQQQQEQQRDSETAADAPSVEG